MDLEAYLREPVSTESPRTSGWLLAGLLDVPSGSVLLADPTFMYHAEPIEVGPGKLRVEVQLSDFGGRRLVSRLRATRGSGGEPGAGIQRFIVDSTRAGLADVDLFLNATQDLDDDGYEAFMSGARSDDLVGTLHPEGTAPVIFASTGFGSGAYLVREIVREGGRVGFQVDFAILDVDGAGDD